MNSIQLSYIPSDKKYQILKPLLNKEWAILLDSGACLLPNNVVSTKDNPSKSTNKKENSSKKEQYRRFDICVLKPTIKLTYNHQQLNITKNSEEVQHHFLKPLEAMKSLLKDYSLFKPNELDSLNLPFNGGWVGYISYDFHPEQTFKVKDDDLQMPLIRMGLFQWALITDNLQETTTLYNFGLKEDHWILLCNEVKTLLEIKKHTSVSSQLESIFKSNLSFNDYSTAFNKIQDYIIEGDCYQVNFSQRFQSSFTGDPFELYSQLALENNAPFSAYLNFKDQQILSLSPERFIQSNAADNKTIVITQPIKGTLPRDNDPIKDKALALQLSNSEKDKAENLMIVDLLRNDLSKTAAKGSVKVTELFGLYHFESVHHLISTITSTLDNDYDNFDLLATTLPGGSITGAPKIRAMEIIDELEPHNRGIYCGIIGYMDFKGNMDTNICIRTLVVNNQSYEQKLYCWAGGGLVADSVLEQEYQETFDKLAKILPILNSTVKQI